MFKSASSSLVPNSSEMSAGNRWTETLQQPQEQAAFFNLLDEYFARGASPPAPQPAAARFIPPSAASSTRPTASLPTPIPRNNTTSVSSPSFNTSVSKAVLDNPSISSAALRKAGMGTGSAAALSKFGAKHSETLAPHVAHAAETGWVNKAKVGGSLTTPSGLTSSGGKGVSASQRSCCPTKKC